MPYPVITASEPAPVPYARTSDRFIMHPGRIAAMKRLVLALIATYACSALPQGYPDRKSTRLNSSHSQISYAVFCLKKKKNLIMCYTMYSTTTDVIQRV